MQYNILFKHFFTCCSFTKENEKDYCRHGICYFALQCHDIRDFFTYIATVGFELTKQMKIKNELLSQNI